MNSPSSPQHGFTLVELAIALLIIGILIGGILKGIELVENARITNMAIQIKAYDTATTIFSSNYRALPGDIRNPEDRVPSCDAAPCNDPGDGNGRITEHATDETTNFWIHLAKTKLVEGIDPQITTWRDNIRTTIGGCYQSNFISLAPPQDQLNANVLHIFACSPGNDDVMLLTSRQTAQIDIKLDDGAPYTGDVRGDNEVASVENCIGADGQYDQPNDVARCIFYYKIQAR